MVERFRRKIENRKQKIAINVQREYEFFESHQNSVRERREKRFVSFALLSLSYFFCYDSYFRLSLLFLHLLMRLFGLLLLLVTLLSLSRTPEFVVLFYLPPTVIVSFFSLFSCSFIVFDCSNVVRVCTGHK